MHDNRTQLPNQRHRETNQNEVAVVHGEKKIHKNRTLRDRKQTHKQLDKPVPRVELGFHLQLNHAMIKLWREHAQQLAMKSVSTLSDRKSMGRRHAHVESTHDRICRQGEMIHIEGYRKWPGDSPCLQSPKRPNRRAQAFPGRTRDPPPLPATSSAASPACLLSPRLREVISQNLLRETSLKRHRVLSSVINASWRFKERVSDGVSMAECVSFVLSEFRVSFGVAASSVTVT